MLSVFMASEVWVPPLATKSSSPPSGQSLFKTCCPYVCFCQESLNHGPQNCQEPQSPPGAMTQVCKEEPEPRQGRCPAHGRTCGALVTELEAEPSFSRWPWKPYCVHFARKPPANYLGQLV